MKKILSAILLPLAAACSADFTLTPAPGAQEANIDTRITITFKQAPQKPESGFVRIFDAKTGEAVDSLDLSIPAGPLEPRTYSPDCDYTKVPYDYSPRTFIPTNRNTVPGTPSGTAEPNPPCYQLNIIGGFTDAFHFQPVLLRGNKAIICLHNNVLEYGHSYRVEIDGSVFGRNIPAWEFSTKAQEPEDVHNLTVDCRGAGDFDTVQGALDAIKDADSVKTTVTVMPGDYEEIVYARCKRNLEIRGLQGRRDDTRVHYANNEVFNPHPLSVKNNEKEGAFPYRRAAFALDHCNDIVIRDITIATDSLGQAEGLLLNSERAALYNVHIIGDGDALQANGSVYLEECEIDGGWDAILGRGSVYLYRCALRNWGGPFTWVRNFAPAHGDVFVECTFESKGETPIDYGRSRSNHGSSYPDAEVVVIDCKVKNLLPEGWSALDEPTQKMLEFNTRDLDTGEPVDVSLRHPISRQLDPVADSALIDFYRHPENVLGGLPKSPENESTRDAGLL